MMWRRALIGVGETARGGGGLNAASLVLLGTVSHLRYRKSQDAAARRLRPFFGGGSKSETIRTFRATAEMKATSPLVDYSNLNSLIAGKCHRRCTYPLFPRPGVLLADGQKNPQKLILLHSASRFSDGNGDNANQRVCPRQKNGSSISVNRLASLSFCRCQPPHRQRVFL